MILIRNAHILPMVGDDLPCGDILINNGRIEAIGVGLSAGEDAQIIDAAGKYALPGFIDAHCHVGISEDGMGFEGEDCNEIVEPVCPQLRAIDALNPFDPALREAMEHGITTACTGPGSANVLGGQFAAIKTYGHRIDDMVIKAPLAVKAAFGENPKRCYSEHDKSPSTRMATAALLRETLIEAQEYCRKLDTEDAPDRDLKLEIMAEVLSGLPIKAHAHRADDIMTALRIAREFDLNMTIEHCTEGHLIADVLKEENAQVILGPLVSDRSKIELRNMDMKAPAILAKAGVPFAIMTDHPVFPLKYLPVSAALAVREGLDEREALRAITINAARITGIDDRVGSLETGKDADVVLFDGEPLDYRTRVTHVWINGRLTYEG
ncbi:MAG: amidohydrolase [Eubacteriales bacterium]|nr:amidohydrolase [Eubacteriales bacterium]